jgi:hypothetical protein
MGGVLYGQIPSASIDRFAVRWGIDDGDEFRRFIRIVRAIDAIETAKLNEKANKKV